MAQADFEADRVQGFLAGGAQEAVLAADWLPKFRSPERLVENSDFKLLLMMLRKLPGGGQQQERLDSHQRSHGGSLRSFQKAVSCASNIRLMI